MANTRVRLDFDSDDFFGIFRCQKMEEAVQDIVNGSMAKGNIPEFPEQVSCKCRFSACTHTREQIIDILKTNGIWSEIHARLNGNISSAR